MIGLFVLSSYQTLVLNMKRSLALVLTLSSALVIAAPQAQAVDPANAKAKAEAAIAKVENVCSFNVMNLEFCLNLLYNLKIMIPH